MALVSVIVPVYNTAKYVSRCLDSILGQTLGDMEIICVDDGSTDSSPAILREYAKKDSRLRVITKENQGLVAARKTGVKEASGKYIGYVECVALPGAAAMDTVLPVVVGATHERITIYSFTSGVLLSLAVPVAVSGIIAL